MGAVNSSALHSTRDKSWLSLNNPIYLCQISQARLKHTGMDPDIKMLKKWTSTYVWKAIVREDSLVIVHLVVWALVSIRSAVEIKCVTWK